MDHPPPDHADHAEDFAHRWRDKLEAYCAVRMEELGIPEDMIGQPDYDGTDAGTPSTRMAVKEEPTQSASWSIQACSIPIC